MAMLFGQFSGQTGLRGIESGIESNRKALYHLGVKRVKRSTLSYANNNRSSKIFENVFQELLTKILCLVSTRRLSIYVNRYFPGQNSDRIKQE